MAVLAISNLLGHSEVQGYGLAEVNSGGGACSDLVLVRSGRRVAQVWVAVVDRDIASAAAGRRCQERCAHEKDEECLCERHAPAAEDNEDSGQDADRNSFEGA